MSLSLNLSSLFSLSFLNQKVCFLLKDYIIHFCLHRVLEDLHRKRIYSSPYQALEMKQDGGVFNTLGQSQTPPSHPAVRRNRLSGFQNITLHAPLTVKHQ